MSCTASSKLQEILCIGWEHLVSEKLVLRLEKEEGGTESTTKNSKVIEGIEAKPCWPELQRKVIECFLDKCMNGIGLSRTTRF